MKKSILITLPRYDDVTEYLSEFSKGLFEEAKKREINMRPLRDKEATRTNFERTLQKLPCGMVFLNGHGSNSQILGHEREVLLDSDNIAMLKDKIVYARSCESGGELGKTFSNESKGCFIGYKRKFRFLADSEWTANPSKDPVASLFIEPSNQVAVTLMKGHTSQEAYDNSKMHMLKSIKSVLKSEIQESFIISSELWNNFDGQVIYGNTEAKL